MHFITPTDAVDVSTVKPTKKPGKPNVSNDQASCALITQQGGYVHIISLHYYFVLLKTEPALRNHSKVNCVQLGQQILKCGRLKIGSACQE